MATSKKTSPELQQLINYFKGDEELLIHLIIARMDENEAKSIINELVNEHMSEFEEPERTFDELDMEFFDDGDEY